MPRQLPLPAASPSPSSSSVHRWSTPLLLLLALIFATNPVSSQPEAGDGGFYGDNGQTAAELEALGTLLDNLEDYQREALEPQLRRLYNGHLLNGSPLNRRS